jgi:hypothetical protein
MIPSLGDAAEAYAAAQKAARGGNLTVLDQPAGCSEIPLGLIEIPLKKIRGTYAVGRSHALSEHFIPLLAVGSEFAAKWISLYASVLAVGVTEPIKVYEYIGYYYVLEGHKRVSVAQALENYSLPAQVTRLMPPPGEDTPELAVFFELLGDDKRKPIRHMWFSIPGRYTELLALCGGECGLLEDVFSAFRAVYHKRGFDRSLPCITTGDAFWQYVKLYGLPVRVEVSVLRKQLDFCLPQWEFLSGAKPKPLFFIKQGILPSVVFAYGDADNVTREAHEAGRFALKRAFPEMVTAAADDLPAGTWDILFAIGPSLSDAALRAALEKRYPLVMLCGGGPAGLLNTYSADTGEAAFLLGALAGCLSASANLGWRAGPHDFPSFGQGAAAARPAARAETDMSKADADMAVLPRMPEIKAFPGTYAHLCSLSPNGAVKEVLAAAAWQWDIFYVNFVRDIIENGFPADRPHFRLGLEYGVLDVHLTAHAPGAHSCLSVFRHALVNGILPITV